MIDCHGQAAAIEARTCRRAAPTVRETDKTLRRFHDLISEILLAVHPFPGQCIIFRVDNVIVGENASLLKTISRGMGFLSGGIVTKSNFIQPGLVPKIIRTQPLPFQGFGEPDGIVKIGKGAHLDRIAHTGQFAP